MLNLFGSESLSGAGDERTRGGIRYSHPRHVCFLVDDIASHLFAHSAGRLP